MKNLFITLTFILTFCSIAHANAKSLKYINEEVEKIKISLDFEIQAPLCKEVISDIYCMQESEFNSNNLTHNPMLASVNWPCLIASAQVLSAYINTGMEPALAQKIAHGVYLGCIGQLPGRNIN